MKIKSLTITPYTIPFLKERVRKGLWLELTSVEGLKATGEIAPLPGWSKETVEEAFFQIESIQKKIIETSWEQDLKELEQWDLYTSVSFGLESALLTLLSPLELSTLSYAALFMGSYEEILDQAKAREDEGFTSAKLKVSGHSFLKAASLIEKLQNRFHLRIDVNRAWETKESLSFFADFSLNAFDYVEEPFKNPKELDQFLHPLAVDESFPQDLSIHELEKLGTLKALIYKPTLQGALIKQQPLLSWLNSKKINLVLSSSFESPLGLKQIALYAQRLELTSPIGIGTYHHMQNPDYLLF